MKKALDERLKHRLIGMIVILSLMIIFLPPMMKHSTHNFDELTSYRLPKKPPMPKISVLNKTEMFKKVKVAAVSIPHPAKVKTHLSRAQYLSRDPSIQMAQMNTEAKTLQSDEVFTIQLATFSHEANAQALVRKLRAKGFAATAQLINHQQGELYQVIVGQLKHREQAIDLQKKLVNNTQLNGLIIKTKVS